MPALPLTVDKIAAVASALKAGSYASFANYASRPKAAHIDAYSSHRVPWSGELRHELAKAQRSVTRGIGPGRRSQPLDILRLAGLDPDLGPFTPASPVGPRAFGILGGFFLTREIEISLALANHVVLNTELEEVTWNLPASKCDPRGLRELRSLGCT